MVLTTHPHLSAEVEKEKGYTSTHPLGLHGLLWENLYLYLYLQSVRDVQLTFTVHLCCVRTAVRLLILYRPKIVRISCISN